MLAKCKGLSPAQLCTLLLNASEATFAGISVFLSTHLDIILGIASGFVVHEKGTVATVQNVNFWITEFWVLMGVTSPVFVTKEFSPEKCQHDSLSVACYTHMIGARCAEYSQWNITSVFSRGGDSKSCVARRSLSLTFMAPSIWPPSYSYSNRQSIMIDWS